MGDAFQARAGTPSGLSQSPLSQAKLLIAIAERCEAATGPDRELDGAIRKATHGDFGFCGDNEGAWWCCNCAAPAVDLTQEPGCGAPMGILDERTSYPNDWRDDERLLAYTASIDAAMTLVPEGSDWMLGRFDQVVGGERPCASVFWADGDLADEAAANAATPALALCAAAFRARAQGIEAQRATTTQIGVVEDESPVASAMRPKGGQ